MGGRAANQVHLLADGRALGYAEYGDPSGRPVLALHGTPGSRFMFALADEAARERGLRLIAPERPGYGLSEPHRYDNLDEAAEDISALVDWLGIARFAVIGVSGGSPYAVALAARVPDRITLLALVSPIGPVAECGEAIPMSKMHRLVFTKWARSEPTVRSFFSGLKLVLRFAPRLAYGGLKRRASRSDREVLAGEDVRDSLRLAIGEGLRTGVFGVTQDARLFCGAWGLKLEAIDVPAVMWQGSDDTIVAPEAAYYLARKLPNCRLDAIHGSGHYWVFRKFGMILDTVQAALGAVPNRLG